MCLGQMSLDFEGKTYLGRIQEYAYQIAACILRENYDMDVSQLMETQDEEKLQETVERLQKNEIKQVWQELFRPMGQDLSKSKND